MRTILCLAPLAFLIGCDSDSPQVASNLNEARAAVEENFERWQLHQLDTYWYTISELREVGCPGGDDDTGDQLPAVRVFVQDGEVQESFIRDMPDSPFPVTPHLATIDDMFNWTLAELDREPQIVGEWISPDLRTALPAFDPDFNFISSIYIKNETNEGCMGVAFSVGEFN
ncbi:MAG: hypothetical protein JJU10_11605 [Idiomarina sp.]|nr:hypothetical protein [Idiomarina sp.]